MKRVGLLSAILWLGACSPQQATAPTQPSAEQAPAVAAPVNAPPLVDGVYVAKDACPGEGCYLKGKIKAYDAVDLFDGAGSKTAIGKIASGEWVEILGTEDRLAPRRGVVREALGRYAVGDEIYLLSSQGEGCMDAWAKGALTSWCDPDTGLEPENSPPLDFPDPVVEPEGLGLWVKVKLEQGKDGWISDVSAFACTGLQDRDADCPPLPQ